MNYRSRKKAVLILEDGTIFHGKALGKEGEAYGEVCFNTGMTGYQEIFTDPSYYGQLMIATNVHIGNYGVHQNENESNSIKIAGLIVKNFSSFYSRNTANESLSEFLETDNILAISDVDTRALVNHIRDHGAMNAVISTHVHDIDNLKAKLREVPNMSGLELASKVSTSESYVLGDSNADIKIAVLDIGVKKNILNNLVSRGAFIKVFPFDSTFEEIKKWNPDGYFLSNGPGDPEPLTHAITLAKNVIESGFPLFGICLGHQVIALANGISTFKMHNGHRGINHPVKNIITGKGEITSQNHGFAIHREEVESHPNIEITHVHLNDNTVAGIRLTNKKCFSVQFHPEASPGPNDSTYLFDQFFDNIKASKLNA